MRLSRKQIIAIAAGVAAVAAIAVGAVLLSGGEPEEPALEPLIAPPLIGEAGVLRVGLDLDYPPFAGEDKGQTVGLDVDVAAALADSLGLRLEMVDVGPDDFAKALLDGEIDIAMGAIPITESVLADVSFAGSYADDGPAFFSASESTGSVPGLAGKQMGAQEGSSAFWTLEALYGEGVAQGYATLREAIEAADSGELDLVAGDAIVAAYIARDYPAVRFIDWVEESVPLGVAVSKEADDLEEAIREALDSLAADGILAAIHAKWVGSLPLPASLSLETTRSAE